MFEAFGEFLFKLLGAASSKDFFIKLLVCTKLKSFAVCSLLGFCCFVDAFWVSLVFS